MQNLTMGINAKSGDWPICVAVAAVVAVRNHLTQITLRNHLVQDGQSPRMRARSSWRH